MQMYSQTISSGLEAAIIQFIEVAFLAPTDS